MSIECISLFSGAGGLDFGAKSAGVDITHFIENDSDSIETLKLNNRNKGEILKEDVSDFHFKKLKRGKKQIIIGGPPCQPFSKNGYWIKNSNRKIDLDPRNMIDQYVRLLMKLNLQVFCLKMLKVCFIQQILILLINF